MNGIRPTRDFHFHHQLLLVFLKNVAFSLLSCDMIWIGLKTKRRTSSKHLEEIGLKQRQGIFKGPDFEDWFQPKADRGLARVG